MSTFVCRTCGVEFKRARSQKYTCSRACERKWYLDKYSPRREKKCTICGKNWFIGGEGSGFHGKKQKYCSAECQEKAHREKHYQRLYKISVSDYDMMLAKQGARCAICGTEDMGGRRPGKKVSVFAVDHDHVTGQVRGLLCMTCNFMIGYAGDDVTVLQRAIEYLKTSA